MELKPYVGIGHLERIAGNRNRLPQQITRQLERQRPTKSVLRISFTREVGVSLMSSVPAIHPGQGQMAAGIARFALEASEA